MLQKISFEDLAKILFTPFVHISHENTKIAIISARLLTFQAFLELLVLRLYLLTFYRNSSIKTVSDRTDF